MGIVVCVCVCGWVGKHAVVVGVYVCVLHVSCWWEGAVGARACVRVPVSQCVSVCVSVCMGWCVSECVCVMRAYVRVHSASKSRTYTHTCWSTSS